MMAGVDGYEVARRLRQRAGDWVPIIFLSAMEDDEDLRKGIEAGGDDYLLKPVSPVVLGAKIRAMRRIDEMRRRLVSLSTQLSEANAALERLAQQDALTGLANRRQFDAVLAHEWARARRDRRPISLVMADVDFFKLYNDCYGHPGGDACLRQVATALRSACRRPADLAARYGGEEFALILPDTPVEGAMELAEALLERVRGLGLPHAHSTVAPHVTLSMGVGTCVPDAMATADGFVQRADEALYQAKLLGRNRCFTFEHAPPRPAAGNVPAVAAAMH
jgi:diguanylate cyclase (GGDEF)-like protein